MPTLSSKYRLEHETDPLVQENRELRNENLRLQNTQPKLQLRFRDSTGKLVKVLSASNDFAASLISEVELDTEIDTKRAKLQYVPDMNSAESSYHSPIAAFAPYSKIVTRSQINEYHDKVEAYLALYREHRLEQSRVQVFPHQSIKLDLVLDNSGNAPAKNLDIKLMVFGFGAILVEPPQMSTREPWPPARPEPRFPHLRSHRIRLL